MILHTCGHMLSFKPSTPLYVVPFVAAYIQVREFYYVDIHFALFASAVGCQPATTNAQAVRNQRVSVSYDQTASCRLRRVRSVAEESRFWFLYDGQQLRWGQGGEELDFSAARAAAVLLSLILTPMTTLSPSLRVLATGTATLARGGYPPPPPPRVNSAPLTSAL